MYTLQQYLLSLSDPYGLTHSLGEITLCLSEEGRPLYTVGNSAATFRIRHEGRQKALRCYFRPRPNLEAIYGKGYLSEELFLYETPTTGHWVDVVLTEWIEGCTLTEAIRTAAEAHDRAALLQLAERFDRLALKLLTDNCAHGDLKPDNLILDKEGILHLIDHDATYLPRFRGMISPELGTAAFQHPARTAEDFNERLDDYPAALLSTALHALALDPTLYDRYGARDGLLFDPRHIHHDEAYREALLLFEIHGLPYSYRIAQGLTRATWSQRDLIPIFAALTRDEVVMPHTLPQPYVELGRWGYGTIQGVVVPPVFDWACDFSEGLAAVRMGSHWHFIDPTGAVVLHCPPCKVVKPFRNGLAIIYDEERNYKMDKSGRLFDF